MQAAGEREQNLGRLLEASKKPEGRSSLSTTGTVVTLLRRVPTALPGDLLLILKILRNLCAGEASNQDDFIINNGSVVVNSVLDSPLATVEIRRVGLQILGNVALAGEEHRADVWSTLFPERLLDFAVVTEPGICDTLCMVIDTCCSAVGGRRRLEELCVDEKGTHIMPKIISTSLTGGYHEEWLEWLVTKICIEESYFLQLFQKLGTPAEGYDYDEGNFTSFTTTQAFLLGLLAKCLSERPAEIIIAHDFVRSILKILKEASYLTDFSSRGTCAFPTGFPTTDVFGYALMILRDACAWEDPSLAALPGPADTLLSAGILDVVLSFLQELEPASIIRRSMENIKGNAIVTEGKKVCPYKGFRRDVVSIIGNCLYRRRLVQDEIRKRNAIPLLLQQCVIDDDNPFQREWGLLTVRNLLEGNEENQRYVSELELQDSVNTPEISELGLKVVVGKNDGCAKLVNIS